MQCALELAPSHYMISDSLVICQFLWNYLKIREQKIKTLTPREAGYTFKLTDKALLDVRPSNERQKVCISPIIFEHIKRLPQKNTQKSCFWCILFCVGLVYSKTGMLQAWVKGSTWIPIFDVDTSVDLGGLSKKVSNFVMGTPLLPSESELCPDTCYV
jgi:hypothetical protein